MDADEIAKLAAWKLQGTMSCARCAYLYLHDRGYSNWTVTETDVLCALDRNPNLVDGPSEPHDWNWDPANDNWPKTNNSRCSKYEPIDCMIQLDVDGTPLRANDGPNMRVLEAIAKHSGRSIE